ncbi:hypothetical protein Tco_0501076, partial [Tanacetum coccineum]
FSGLEVGNAQLSQQVSVLQAQVMGEKRIMAAFEDFKKHEDEQVNAILSHVDSNCRSSVGNWAQIRPSCHEMCRVHEIKASFCQCCVCGDSQGYE